jgi:hypothetical protein
LDFFSKLESSEGVALLSAATVTVGEEADGKRPFAFRKMELDRMVRGTDYVLFGVHYYTHVLARYPRYDSDLDRHGMLLRQYVHDIVEQGIWPGSDLIRYAGLSDRIRLLGPDEELEGRGIRAVVIRTVMAEDLDMALEVPEGVDPPELNQSVVAVLQALTNMIGESEIELLDKSMRYIHMYVGEGADYASLAAAQNLANRAFREAGGEAV